jgi:DNA-binding response OmpR family regulator
MKQHVRPMRILFADDETSIQELMRIELPRLGHEATVCPDGRTALAALDRTSYDCVIVDLDMPGVGGLDVIARVRETSADTETVIITGKSSLESAVTAVRQGVFDYLTKPCKLAEIQAVLERVRKKRELTSRMRALERRVRRAEGTSQLKAKAEGASQHQAKAKGTSQRKAKAKGASQPQAKAEGANQHQAEATGASLLKTKAKGTSPHQATAKGEGKRKASPGVSSAVVPPGPQDEHPAHSPGHKRSRSGSAHVQSAVHREVGTRGVTALFRGQPGDDGRDLAGLAQALDGHGGHDLGQHVFTDRFDHVGTDVAGAHGVDRHAFGGQLLR